MPKHDGFKYFTIKEEYMTYVEMLRASPKLMFVEADTRVSYGGRTADYVPKIAIKDRFVATSAGHLGDALEIDDSWLNKTPTENFNVELGKLHDSYNAIYQRQFESAVLGKYGLKISDVKIGPLNEKILEHIAREAEGFAQQGFATRFLFGGYNEAAADMEIHTIRPPGIRTKLLYYGATGSGEDAGQFVLDEYFSRLHRLKPDKKNNIPAAEALYLMTHSMVSATRNIGVGGIPDLLSVTDTDIRNLGKENSAVLFNAVKLEMDDRLTRKDVHLLAQDIFNSDGRPIKNPVIKKSKIPSEYLLG